MSCTQPLSPCRCRRGRLVAPLVPLLLILLALVATACGSVVEDTSAADRSSPDASSGAALAEKPSEERSEPVEPWPVVVDLQPLAVDAAAVVDDDSSALRYLAGFVLTAESEEFGGFSGLECLGDHGLIAVSDRGHWLSMDLGLDAAIGRLTSIEGAQMGPLLDEDGQPVAGRERRDAEELAEAPRGGFLVTFEGDHRAALFAGTEGNSMAGELPQPFPSPREILRTDDNAGFEAVTRLADNRMLFVTEGLRDDSGRLVGWLERGAAAEPEEGVAADVYDDPAYGALRLQPTGPFQPTAADTIPDGPHVGDVLLLQRHYTPETGTRVRLAQLAAADLQVGALIEGRELARFEDARFVDNFEGLAICPRNVGGPLLYLISDDNFSATQRTLLLQFELVSSSDG